MQVPVFRAKDTDSKETVEGFYFEYPVTSDSPFLPGMDDNTKVTVVGSNIAHCLLTYKPTMMGLINEPIGCTIDISTLEFVKFVEVPCSASHTII